MLHICDYYALFWIILIRTDHSYCFADDEHVNNTEVAHEIRSPGEEVPRMVAAAMDVPAGSNAVQEAPLDVRQLMELAAKVDSFVQISRQLDQKMPGTEPVHSIRGASQGRRADLKRKAADITRSSAETWHLHSLPRRIFLGTMQQIFLQRSVM